MSSLERSQAATPIPSITATKKTWWDRIREARERGVFTWEDVNLAATWVTCACGEQDPRIPRNNSKTAPHPKDPYLFRLGTAFADYIWHNDIGAAEIALRFIEKRAAEILSEAKP